MRRRSRSRRAELAAFLAIALGVGGGIAGSLDHASAQDPSVAVVVHLGGAETSIDATTLRDAYDIANRTYTVRASDGTEIQPPPQVTGASIRTVLELAGANPDTVSFLQIERVDGSWSVLRGSDLSANPPFPDGPPIVWLDSPAVRYLRPVRDAQDSNSSDNLSTSTNQPLEIFAHTGNLLDVSASADTTQVDAGSPVSFSATATGELPGENVSIQWNFGDGDSASGASASHTFANEGSYKVFATASGDQDSGGSSDFLRIQVGSAPPPADNPDQGGGGGDTPVPGSLSEGPRNGGHHSGTAGGAGNGGGTNGGSANGGGSGSGSTSATPTQPAGTTPTAPATPSSDGTNPVPTAPAPPSTGEDAQQQAPAPQPGQVVVGQLLANLGVPVEATQPAPAPAVTHPPSHAKDPLPAIGWAALIIALLGAGALIEARRSRHPATVAP